jgi:methylmalonyl-CoA/ethylmalonyl-CoA epimerase
MLKRVHHINLLVRDLDTAVERYRSALAVQDFIFAELPTRGVRTARFKVGQSWIVLVEPVDPDGVPGRHLAEHGEGLFLLSLEVDELTPAIERCDSAGAVVATDTRKGLEDWEVIDLDPGYFMGAALQLVATGG